MAIPITYSNLFFVSLLALLCVFANTVAAELDVSIFHFQFLIFLSFNLHLYYLFIVMSLELCMVELEYCYVKCSLSQIPI